MRRVRITGGMQEFVGKTGTVIGFEQYGKRDPKLWRVRLDTPVTIEGVGEVRSDLWENRYLRTIR